MSRALAADGMEAGNRTWPSEQKTADMFHHKIPKEVMQLSNVKLKTIKAETTMQFLEYFSESASEGSLRCHDPEDLLYM